MITKKHITNGVNANVSLEPNSVAQSTSNIHNNIYINKRDDGKEDVVITRDIELSNESTNEELKDIKELILDAYVKILLDQDKTLIANIIFKNDIIIPIAQLQYIIKVSCNAEQVEIHIDEDIKCCSSKANPIRKIEAIKIIESKGEVVTDFRTKYNIQYNDLVNKYHRCLKYCSIE